MYLTMYLFKKLYFMVLSDRERDTERPYKTDSLLFPTKTNFKITMYLFKKSYFMPLFDRGPETERPFLSFKHY